MSEISQIGPLPKPPSKLPSKKTKTIKAIFYLLIIIILLTALLYLLLEQQKKRQGPQTTTSSSKSKVSTILPYTPLPLNKIPDVFPHNIPIPVKPPELLLLSYSHIVKDKKQTTIQYNSVQSPVETLQLYKTFLEKDKWTILSIVEEGVSMSLHAKKKRDYSTNYISITINNKLPSNGAFVDLTLVVPYLFQK